MNYTVTQIQQDRRKARWSQCGVRYTDVGFGAVKRGSLPIVPGGKFPDHSRDSAAIAPTSAEIGSPRAMRSCVPFLLPETQPPGFKKRAQWAGIGLFALAASALLYWYTGKVADPNWRSSTVRLSYMNDWQPIWRQSAHALAASLLLFCGLAGFWKAIRPFPSRNDRDGSASEDR